MNAAEEEVAVAVVAVVHVLTMAGKLVEVRHL